MFTRILVPTDFSGPSEAALEYARTLASRFGASLHLIHVIEPPTVAGAFGAEAYIGESPAITEALLSDAEARLDAQLPPAERTRLHATTEVIYGRPAAAILNCAESRGVSLIVMGTHGRTGLAHAVMGSVSEHVVRRAPCSVLTVHAMPVRNSVMEPDWCAAHMPA